MKITLKKFTQADFPYYFKLVNDEKVMEMNGFYSKEFKDFDGLPGEILELNITNK